MSCASFLLDDDSWGGLIRFPPGRYPCSHVGYLYWKVGAQNLYPTISFNINLESSDKMIGDWFSLVVIPPFSLRYPQHYPLLAHPISSLSLQEVREPQSLQILCMWKENNSCWGYGVVRCGKWNNEDEFPRCGCSQYNLIGFFPRQAHTPYFRANAGTNKYQIYFWNSFFSSCKI